MGKFSNFTVPPVTETLKSFLFKNLTVSNAY